MVLQVVEFCESIFKSNQYTHPSKTGVQWVQSSSRIVKLAE
jgi:hypothetical protein